MKLSLYFKSFSVGYDPLASPSKDYLDVTRERMRSVLYAAVRGGHDAVVLGALGCGVFANPPEAKRKEKK